MTQPTKFCKDCKWCHEPESAVPTCHNPALDISPVTGEIEYVFCYANREDSYRGKCGVDGRWWETHSW